MCNVCVYIYLAIIPTYMCLYILIPIKASFYYYLKEQLNPVWSLFLHDGLWERQMVNVDGFEIRSLNQSLSRVKVRILNLCN